MARASLAKNLDELNLSGSFRRRRVLISEPAASKVLPRGAHGKEQLEVPRCSARGFRRPTIVIDPTWPASSCKRSSDSLWPTSPNKRSSPLASAGQNLFLPSLTPVSNQGTPCSTSSAKTDRRKRFFRRRTAAEIDKELDDILQTGCTCGEAERNYVMEAVPNVQYPTLEERLKARESSKERKLREEEESFRIDSLTKALHVELDKSKTECLRQSPRAFDRNANRVQRKLQRLAALQDQLSLRSARE
mmetsp:Transcript_122648/g.192472  ORF Transcript_122648/g.192472 Transcript_122648/m.192472 type:complete len:247 (-) Transcript_122648:80-820(-)